MHAAQVWALNPDVQGHPLLDSEVDKELSDDVVNWHPNLARLLPIKTAADHNCLCHSIAIGVWGAQVCTCYVCLASKDLHCCIEAVRSCPSKFQQGPNGLRHHHTNTHIHKTQKYTTTHKGNAPRPAMLTSPALHGAGLRGVVGHSIHVLLHRGEVCRAGVVVC